MVNEPVLDTAARAEGGGRDPFLGAPEVEQEPCPRQSVASSRTLLRLHLPQLPSGLPALHLRWQVCLSRLQTEAPSKHPSKERLQRRPPPGIAWNIAEPQVQRGGPGTSTNAKGARRFTAGPFLESPAPGNAGQGTRASRVQSPSLLQRVQ